MNLKELLGLVLRTTKTDGNGKTESYSERRVKAYPWLADFVSATTPLAATRVLAAGVVEAFDTYTLSDSDNGKVIEIGTDNDPIAYVYLDEALPPGDGFSCSIVARTANVKVCWNGVASTLVGPNNATGVWAINDTVNNGVGMGATLFIKDSGTLIARIVGAVELSA